MNTIPNEICLARWLDDDLEGAELTAFEAAAQIDAALLERRQAQREWRATLAAAIPAAVDPPYPEFFNHRLAKAIRESLPVAPSAPALWRGWWLPATAVAGMVLAFWAGTKTGSVTQVVSVAGPGLAPPAMPRPTVYTPEHGVDAEWFASPAAAATVIVLEGVDAIPDTLDFSESLGWCAPGDCTAALDAAEPAEVTQ